MNRKFVVLGMIVLGFCAFMFLSSSVQAQDERQNPMMNQMPEKSGQAMNVGNTVCPVSGLDVNSKGTAAQHEYKGKIYNFCCTDCIEEFKKNPEKYVNIAEKTMSKQKTNNMHQKMGKEASSM